MLWQPRPHHTRMYTKLPLIPVERSRNTVETSPISHLSLIQLREATCTRAVAYADGKNKACLHVPPHLVP